MKKITFALKKAAREHIAAYEERNQAITTYDLIRFTYRGNHLAVAETKDKKLQIYQRIEGSNYYYPFGETFRK